MNHLLIWEEVPENTKAYVLEPEDVNLIELAKAAHGHFINESGDDPNEAVNKLSEALLELESVEAYNYAVEKEEIIAGGPFIAVYICGYIM